MLQSGMSADRQNLDLEMEGGVGGNSPGVESSGSIRHFWRAYHFCDLSRPHRQHSLLKSFDHLAEGNLVRNTEGGGCPSTLHTRKTKEKAHLNDRRKKVTAHLLLASLEFEGVLVRIARAPELGSVVHQPCAVHLDKLLPLDLPSTSASAIAPPPRPTVLAPIPASHRK